MGSTGESLQGFPAWQMFVVCLIRFSEPIAFTSMFPYVYFMIRDFGIVKDDANISAFTGYLSASFAFFQFLLCVYWSKLSDKVGRKPILLFGLVGTGSSMLIFGFAKNFYVALGARSLMGALNGNIAVLRTVIGEIATERRHQALAFSTLPLLWNFGSVLGPLVGGSKYLTRPNRDSRDIGHDKDDFYNRFLNKYPYALSNVVVALFLGFSFIMGVLFLEETHYKFRKRRDIGLELGDWLRSKLGYDIPVRPWQRGRKNKVSKKRSTYLRADQVDSTEGSTLVPTSIPTENDPLLTTSADFDVDDPLYSDLDDEESVASRVDDPTQLLESASIDSAESIGPMTRRMSSAFIRRFSSNLNTRPTLSRSTSNAYSIFTDTTENEGNFKTNTSAFNRETFTPPVVETITGNFLLSFQQLVFSEFLPVLLAGDFMKDKLQFPFTITGGFGYDSNTIGTLLSTTGFLGVLVVLFVFPMMDRHLKTIVGFRVSTSIFPFVYFVLPFLIFTLHDYNPNIPPWVSKVSLYSLSAVATLASATAFPQCVILIHRASLPQHRALINGTTLSLTSLARCIAPLTWGWLISFFDSYSLGGLSWWLLSVMALFGCVQAFKMKEYNEDLKTIEDIEEE
ncbi:uncharacterized membrane protein [[Candida] railenensis]|uniref:Uncharacterized membrane protein n=1 Tax=[Candida] railenensis TaxID=45579 RepID=A0A9P0QPH6_9ASCO|nr:uncharacterized membrane protein [[Candida] railenensis]